MSTNQATGSTVPIACDMSALAPALREQHEWITRSLFAAVEEVQELSDGYAFRLPSENEILQNAAQWIANERLCCPFFTFALRLEPQGAALWLSLTGSEDVKAFIPMEFNAVLAPSVASAFTTA